MERRKLFSFLIGFFALFSIYHFPEFFSEFWIAATFKIGFLVAAFLIALAQGWKGLGGYGLGIKGKWGWHLLIGILTGLGFFTLYFFTSITMGFQTLIASETLDTIFKSLPLILLMTAIPSMAEDILTRGYLYAHLGKWMSPFSWVILSSIIYVLNHIWRLNDGPAVLSYLFLLGMVLAVAVQLVRSLWLAFGIHWGANIAFEVINSSFQTRSIGDGSSDTYVLAGIWGVLLIILLSLYLIKNKTLVPKFKGSFN